MTAVHRVRRATAWLALAGLVSPGAAAAVVTLHLSSHHAPEHDDEARDVAAELAGLAHGHSHERATPQHDHPLLVGTTPAVRASKAAQPLPAVSPYGQPAAAASAADGALRLEALGLAGTGPPRPGRSRVLRI